MLITLIILALSITALVVWMAGGIQSPRTFTHPPSSRGAETTSSDAVETITVIVWNIAWGYGWGSEGTGKARPKAHFEAAVTRIGDFIKQCGADVALLQEVDFGSRRSGGFDQTTILTERSGLRWSAEARSWDANWIPFPYWPPKEHFGAMRSGGAILSRFPIVDNEVRLLDKPREYPWYFRLFYLFRYLQKAKLVIGGRTFSVYNTHLEAFKQKNREDQAKLICGVLSSNDNTHVIFGGDMNAVPPESTQRSHYADETDVTTSHETDITVGVLRSITGLNDSLPAEVFLRDESAYFTFPAHEPNRKLDHVFFGDGLQLIDIRVAKEAGDVSDHLPLLLRFKVTP